MRGPAFVCGVFAIALGGCYVGGSPNQTTSVADAAPCDPAQTPTIGDLPDAVNAVLVDKCQACHAVPTKNRAPFALVSFEDTQEPFGLTAKRRWQRMADVVEPGGLPHMPYGVAPQLSDDQLATLRAWFARCAMPIAEGTGHDLTDDGGLPEHVTAH